MNLGVRKGVRDMKIKFSMLLGEKKLKVTEVARGTGLSNNTLYKLYEGNQKRIDLETIEKVCKFLKCSPSDLFEIEYSKE